MFLFMTLKPIFHCDAKLLAKFLIFINPRKCTQTKISTFTVCLVSFDPYVTSKMPCGPLSVGLSCLFDDFILLLYVLDKGMGYRGVERNKYSWVFKGEL